MILLRTWSLSCQSRSGDKCKCKCICMNKSDLGLAALGFCLTITPWSSGWPKCAELEVAIGNVPQPGRAACCADVTRVCVSDCVCMCTSVDVYFSMIYSYISLCINVCACRYLCICTLHCKNQMSPQCDEKKKTCHNVVGTTFLVSTGGNSIL